MAAGAIEVAGLNGVQGGLIGGVSVGEKPEDPSGAGCPGQVEDGEVLMSCRLVRFGEQVTGLGGVQGIRVVAEEVH